MEPHLEISATECTPLVRFDPPASVLLIEGESYPEDVTELFGVLSTWLRDYPWDSRKLQVVFRLYYLNTSSTKAILDVVRILEDARASGGNAEIVWSYESGFDMMRQAGEELLQGCALPAWVEEFEPSAP